MPLPRPLVAALLTVGLLAPATLAGSVVQVSVHGSVEYNSITKAPFTTVTAGEGVILSFRVDSDVFVDSGSFPTRGYAIDKTSFTLAFDTATVALQSPFPAGQTPYFVIRDNDPAVDGFMVSTSVNGPAGVPLVPTGVFGHFINNFYVTYGGGLLPSLDILDAVGSYDFTGLTVFNWTVDDGPVNPLGMIFEDMTIEVVPQTWTDEGSALAGVAGNPKLVGSGDLSGGSGNALTLTRAAPGALAGLIVGFSSTPAAFKGGVLLPSLDLGPIFVPTSGGGGIVLPFTMPGGVPSGTSLWLQWAIPDAAAIHGVALSNALLGLTP